jgi:hypothetical protein
MPSSNDLKTPNMGTSSKKKWASIANKLVQQTGNLSSAERSAKKFIKPALQQLKGK